MMGKCLDCRSPCFIISKILPYALLRFSLMTLWVMPLPASHLGFVRAEVGGCQGLPTGSSEDALPFIAEDRCGALVGGLNWGGMPGLMKACALCHMLQCCVLYVSDFTQQNSNGLFLSGK